MPQAATQLSTDDTINARGFTSPLEYDGYNLVWKDEFDKSSIDESVWSFESGNGYNGWGNHELEYYTGRKENAAVNNGYLLITARKENYQGSSYTSARMITHQKKSFMHGRVDIRAKLPEGKGIWPALWMLGENIDSVGWPACGEIDIMEVLGHDPGTLYGTMHWGSASATHHSKGNTFILPAGKFSDEFHVFSLVWEPGSIKLLIDNNEYFSLTKDDVAPDPYPFDDPQYFLFNVAVGGDWPGSPDATTVFPQRMIVDYLRVFQKN